MLSNVEYTAPQYIEEDKNITIQFITIKNGVESDPTEVQLTAKAIAPTAPECGETISGEPNSYVEFSVNTEPNTTIEIVSCSFGTATANGSNIKIVFGDIEEDREVTLIVKAKRGKFESPELTISGNCVIPVPAEPAITGVEEMDDVDASPSVGALQVGTERDDILELRVVVAGAEVEHNLQRLLGEVDGCLLRVG